MGTAEAVSGARPDSADRIEALVKYRFITGHH